jgi:signal transduction histidine kinase/DNA-binding response OmpR family regulator
MKEARMVQSQKPLILVADDEKNAVLLLTRILERDGFEVESAEDGEITLHKARTLQPDLILMDVQMPRLNGFEVTARLREDPSTARIPVIFVTAAARDPSDVAHGFQLGADDYIRKPYDYHELLARANSKMRARQLEDRLQRRSEELEALVRIGGEFNLRLGLAELTELILVIAHEEFEADHAELFLFDDEQRLLLCRDLSNGAQTPEEVENILSREDTLAGRVYHTQEPILITAAEEDQPLSPLSALDLRSGMGAPLKHHGRLLGILTVGHENPGHFGESNLKMLRSVGEQATLAVRNAQLHAALQSYAQNLESMVETRTQELRAAQAQLVQTEKLAALGRLAAGMAHEVNNPLQPVLNCLETAIEDVENAQPVDLESLRVAESEVQRIKTIVSRLLDFSRPSNEERVPVNLHELIHEVLTLTNKQLERMQVSVEARLSPVEPVMGSPTQLKQVLLNLVLNAMESMPGGGLITIETRADEKGTAILVEDSGSGIDEETMAQIFEPFYSTKGTGTGLGLSVSYGIIQGHGGCIEVESEPSKGSRFTVWLPCHST